MLLVAAAGLILDALDLLVRMTLTAAPQVVAQLPTVPTLRLSLPAATGPLLQAVFDLARTHWRWGLAGAVAVTGLMVLMSASLPAALLISVVALGGGAFLARDQ